jgi:hypothetical protein
MQHMGYVLNIGETGPPAGLLKGLKVTNRMQDLILEEMQLGKTGNEVLASFRARCDIDIMKRRKPKHAAFSVS